MRPKNGYNLANMNDPSGSKIKNNGDVLAFLDEIGLVDGDVTDFLEVN